MKITAALVTFNAEKNIERCLNSIKWADEIIIVDSASTDSTLKIAQKFTHNIFSVDYNNIAKKRMYSLEKATNKWILMIDSDEKVSEELREEIRNLSSETDYDGFYINRKNFYFGKWIKHCGINPDYTFRLFRKNKAKITDRLIHEGVEVDGKCGKLNNSIEHYTVEDLSQLIKKTNFFSTLEAEENFRKNKKITKIGVFTHALSAFIRIYISRKGYKDKIGGLYVSFSYAFVNFLGHLKLLKLQKNLN